MSLCASENIFNYVEGKKRALYQLIYIGKKMQDSEWVG